MVLLGGAMYGTMSSFVKLSYSWGYNAAEISFAQAALAAIFLGTYTLVTGKSIQGKITTLVSNIPAVNEFHVFFYRL